MIGFFFVSIFCNWWIFLSQKRICKLLTILRAVDKRLEGIHVPIDLRKHKEVALALMIFLEAFLFLIVSISFAIEINAGILEPSAAIFISLWFIVKLGMMTVFHFILLVRLVRLRFKRINYYLEEKLSSSSGVESGNDNLNKISSLHDELVDATNQINHCFSYPVWNFFKVSFKMKLIFFIQQLMMMTGNDFTFVTLTIFTLSKIWHQMDWNLEQLSVMIIMWITTHVVVLYVLLHVFIWHISREKRLKRVNEWNLKEVRYSLVFSGVENSFTDPQNC